MTYELHEMLRHNGLQTHIFSNQSVDHEQVVAHKFTRIFKVPVSFSIIGTILRMKVHKKLLLHLPNPFALLLCGIRPSRFKVHIIWHAPARSNFILTRINELSYYIAKKNIEEIIVPYSGHLPTLPKSWEGIKTRILKFPIDKSVQNAAEKTIEKRKTEKYFKIIIIGRLVDYKNHELTIDAVCDLMRQGVKIKVDIVGTGPKYKELKDYCQLKKLENNVHFWGAISNEKKHELLQKSDCLTLVSKDNREMLGMVQYEAFANAIPVIVTDVDCSSVASLARESGGAIVIANGSKNELISAIRCLQENKDLRILYGRKGQDYIRTSFNHKLIKSGWENVLSD